LDDGIQLELKVKGTKRLNDFDSTLHEHHRSKNKDPLLPYNLKIIAFQGFFKVIKAHGEVNPIQQGSDPSTIPHSRHFPGGACCLQDQYLSLTMYLDMTTIKADTSSTKAIQADTFSAKATKADAFSTKAMPMMDTMAKLAN
jgi:hypothetical protein